MTMRDWADERARHDAAKLVDSLVQCGWSDDDIPQGIVDNMAEYIDAALREAEERAALADKYGYNLDAHNNGRAEMRDEIEARLREPDEAMIDAISDVVEAQKSDVTLTPLDACRALAAALFPASKEGE